MSRTGWRPIFLITLGAPRQEGLRQVKARRLCMVAMQPPAPGNGLVTNWDRAR